MARCSLQCYSNGDDRPREIAALEERAFNAWPARQTLLTGGWVLRLSDGLTKRANSANALYPAAPFDEIKATAEELYTRHGLPTIFRLSPLAGSEPEQILERAGYTHQGPSQVLTTPIGEHPEAAEVHIQPVASPAWLREFATANNIAPAQRPAHDRLITSIAPPAAFAMLVRNGRAAAFGIAVYERGMAGLFDILVTPEARRTGAGTQITNALLNWGGAMGATHAYLQATERNQPARNLYVKLGFRQAYSYHYRVARNLAK